jgi:hypothetical protein
LLAVIYWLLWLNIKKIIHLIYPPCFILELYEKIERYISKKKKLFQRSKINTTCLLACRNECSQAPQRK